MKRATGKTKVLRVLRAALLPISTPEITRLTGIDRSHVWTVLVMLHRNKVVRRVNGVPVGPSVRWRMVK